MPSRNSVKEYIENGYYHVYNRGVDKRDIFLDKRDYLVFLSYLKSYLSSPLLNQVQPAWTRRPQRGLNFFGRVQLISYSLMPNHFHLLIKQKDDHAIVTFMKALANAYTTYFNRRRERVGHLFQGRYKAVLVTEESYLLHLTRYIHLNPLNENNIRLNLQRLRSYSYSSYPEYLGIRHTSWIYSQEILSFFKSAQKTGLHDIFSYESFVEDYVSDSAEVLGNLTLE